MKTLMLAALLALNVTGIVAAEELTIKNLYDAFGKDQKGLTKDFGFSALIQYGDLTVLFDSGTDAEIFEHNLSALGIDPKSIDIAIGSHNHHDHIAGFDYLLSVNPDVKFYLPPDFFGFGAPLDLPIRGREPGIEKQLPPEQRYFGGTEDVAKLRSSGRFWNKTVEYVGDDREIAPGVHLIATKSELMGTYVKYPPFDDEPKLIPMPELSVSFETKQGDVLVVGCSHSTVETIVVQAKKHLKRPIRLVAGGYHLLPYGREYIDGLARRMKKEHGVMAVAPSHCSGHLAFSIFKDVFEDDYHFFGLGSRLER